MKLKTSFAALVAVSVSALTSFAADPMQPIDPANYEGPVKVACVGDSITQGAGTRGATYPKQLQSFFGDDWEVENFGVSGRTLMAKGDYPYTSEKAYQNALAMKPDVVVIMLGTNDTKKQNWKFKQDFYSDYQQLVRSFQELESKPRIYVCRPVPVIGEGSFGITEAGIQEQIPQVNQLAEEMGLGVIDVYAALKDFPELIPDRVHPNARGAKKIAEAVY